MPKSDCFTCIDIETANADFASICQIGLARFERGKLVKSWQTLVDPQDFFDGMNVSIHGIDSCDVKGAPIFKDVAETLCEWLGEGIVVCHTFFDRSSLNKAAVKHGVSLPSIEWLDSSRVVRRTWLDRSKSGYGLVPCAEFLGIEFKHHDALEDARTAGEVLLAAMAHSGHNLEEWTKRVNWPIGSKDGKTGFAMEGSKDGLLHGETLVFTGALSMSRKEAAPLAAAAGCDVGDGVTKKTTLVVVGDQDVSKLAAGQKKSSKHRRAEALIAKGQKIRIVGESDFMELIKNAMG